MIISLIMIYLLSIVDYFQTIYAVNIFGIGIELNPIARFLISHNCGFIAKLIVVPILLTVIFWIARYFKRLSWTVELKILSFGVYFLLTIGFLVVIHNFIVLANIGIL